MLARDLFQLKEQSVVVVTGLLIGEVSVGDVVYVIRPEDDYKAVVIDIDKDEDGKVVRCQNSSTGSVALHLVPQGKFKIGEYDVITDIRPQREIDVNVPVVNAGLSGILDSYVYYKNDNSYMDHFVYALAHGHFLVPIRVMDDANDDEFAFAALPSDDKERGKLLPLFTDWGELNKWQGLFETQEKVKTLILTFSDVAGVVSSNEYEGIVLNPFMDVPVSIPSSMIEGITRLDAYKKMVEEVNKQL